MKLCLDDNELLNLWAAEVEELPEQRVHLAQCHTCTERYDECGREVGEITHALIAAADRLPGRDRASIGSVASIGEWLRTAAIFSGAVAFGGAAAFALLLTLGWHPARVSNVPMYVAGNAASVASAPGMREVTARSTLADESQATSSAGAVLYTVDAVTTDPLAAFAYGDSLQADNANAGQDLLFCASADDALCASSAEQG